jgi:hypothetical protein
MAWEREDPVAADSVDGADVTLITVGSQRQAGRR